MKNKYLIMDVSIAYSMLNMKLRDKYSSLSELCDDEDIDMEELLNKFKEKNIIFNEDSNQFTIL